jgi:probable H4MPT-linked C1 transfer pathway protein
MTDVLGLDIGGANLKAAHVQGVARTVPFPLWKKPDRLAAALASLIDAMPRAHHMAVTMTGELCDCFTTKRDGVHFILDSVAAVAGGKQVSVWLTDGTLAEPAIARQRPLEAAAANWLALSTYAGRLAPRGRGLLIDIGSTTTDLIPLRDGTPIPRGRTDTERLQSGELVYTGVKRTPVCALVQEAVPAEVFATTLDVYLVLGAVPEEDSSDTADGRPATRVHAHARLARMLGGDAETCTCAQTLELAQAAAARQLELLRAGLERAVAHLGGNPESVVIAGSGEVLAQRLLSELRVPRCEIVSLSERLGPELSSAACAYAVAVLAQEAHRG